jgi:hypothetical protein
VRAERFVVYPQIFVHRRQRRGEDSLQPDGTHLLLVHLFLAFSLLLLALSTASLLTD